jgi:protein associated with RNAse G/E
MKNPIDRIKGFLNRRGARYIDFSEPYVFNVVPTFDKDGVFYFLDRIVLMPDGSLEFDASDYRIDAKEITFREDEVLETEMKEIADWLNDYRQYINRHAVIEKL